MITIKDKSDCCGCTACLNICSHKAVIMVADEKGFFFPKVDYDRCIDCRLCDKTCPILARKKTERKECFPDAYAVRLKEKDLLLKSSSGGAFTLIANYVLSKGGSVFGASYDDNLKVIHARITNKNELQKLRGSKYSQSELGSIFNQVRADLKDGMYVLFTGTPCQVDGLLHYLRKPYHNLITADVICHSIPSPLFFEEYKHFIEDSYNDKLLSISMKDKTKGWGGDCIKYIFKSGKEIINPEKCRSWVAIFESGLITRDSCFECQYTNLDRPSDFTIGDFWDFEHKRPDIKSKDGTSLILLNTPKAVELFKMVKTEAYIWKTSVDEYMQPRLYTSSIKPSKYNRFWDDYYKYGFLHVYNRYCTISKIVIYKTRIIKLIRKIIKK